MMKTTTLDSLSRDLLLAIAAFVIAFILWQFRALSPIIYPLRLFVTFIHELGHGTAALATGGEFRNFQVESSGAGLAYSAGGVRPIVISAGYVGTAIFGAILLYAANRVKNVHRVAVLLGICFILLTLAYSGLGLSHFNILEIVITLVILGGTGYLILTTSDERSRWLGAAGAGVGLLLLVYFAAGDNVLTVVIGVVSGIALILIGRYADRDLTLFTLNFLAFIVGLNAITDAWILYQIVSQPTLVPHNDATSMARVTAFPAQFWATAWIITAILLLGGAVWLTFIRPFNKNR
ncbi:MAG: M50 family metallopeptidase [Anaerolineae bacterium]|nr:M50 family metallopeptidase [Anaerolineae bacterium]